LPWGTGLIVVLAALALQSQLYTGQENTISGVFMFVVLAQSWNLIGGYTGYACFGQVVFFGLGGYTTAALITHAHMPFWPAMLCSAVVAGVFAVLAGLLLLPLKGHYFAVATLAVAEGMREIVTNVPSLTGGGAGITIPSVGRNAPTAYLGNDGFYLLFLGLAVFSVIVVGLIARGKLGFALRAIHQDEDAAASLGINTTVVKVLAFAIAGMLAGLAGSVYAFQQVTIFPERLFDVNFTVLMVIMVVIGGSGTVIGPVLGAVGLQLLSEYLRVHYPDIHNLILGAIIVVAVILLPEGLVSFVQTSLREKHLSLLDNVRRYRL
jgi:branched-chain amino acid transport system permease protein